MACLGPWELSQSLSGSQPSLCFLPLDSLSRGCGLWPFCFPGPTSLPRQTSPCLVTWLCPGHLCHLWARPSVLPSLRACLLGPVAQSDR